MTGKCADSRTSLLAEWAASGRMPRREFLRRAAALGIGATAAMSFMGPDARADTPKKGGSMRIGMGHGSTNDSIDPALLFNGFQWALGYAIRNSLTEIGAGSVLQPCLASEWTASKDARKWVFTLHSGVEFHNGKTLTTDDVIASINHHRGADSKSSVKPIAKQIESIAADGPDKIVITLANPNADFPYMLASAPFTICPSAADGSIDWKSGVGTGGYVLKDYQAGVKAVFTRNKNYWRTDRAFADDVELLTIHDVAARTNALRSGDIDVMDQVDLKTVAMMEKLPGISVEATQGPLHYLCTMEFEPGTLQRQQCQNGAEACDRS